MFRLEFYATDGESVTEGDFDRLKDAVDRWNDIGSRWFFYPIGVIFNDANEVLMAPDELTYLEGSSREDFEKAIAEGVFDV